MNNYISQLSDRAGYSVFARCARLFRSKTTLKLLGIMSGVPGLKKVVRPKISDLKRPNILVVRCDVLGDIILTIPFLAALRHQFPKSHISILVAKTWVPLARQIKYVDEVLASPLQTNKWSAIANVFRAMFFGLKELRQHRFDLTLCPRWDSDYTDAFLLSFFSFAPLRIAFSESSTEWRRAANRGQDQLFTTIVTDTGVKHEATRSLFFLESLGLSSTININEVEFLCHEDRKAPINLPPGFDPIAVFPGVRDRSRQWPVENFVNSARLIASRHNVIFLALGTQAEANQCSEFCKALGESSINLCGKIDLVELPVLLKLCCAVLSCNSGGAHLAGILNVPVVAIFSHPMDGDPADPCSPDRFRPLGENVIVIQPESLSFKDNGKTSSLSFVTVERVAEAVNGILEKNPKCSR